MKKILFSLVAFAFMLLPVNFVNAQEDTDTAVTYEYESVDDMYEDMEDLWSDWDTGYDYTYEYELDDATAAGLAAATGVLLIVLVVSGLFAIAGYIYMGITMSKTAKHIGHDNPWFAWVPILNVVQIFQMGDMNPLFILLVFIPGIGAVVVGIMGIIAIMNICEKRGYEKALGLLTLVPVANLVLLGMLAWGKKEEK